MSAALLEQRIETPETPDCSANCAALQRLERALEELRAEFRWQVGYWKSMHATAVARNERLTAELGEARGEVRVLKDKLFGRKSEKSRSTDRSNDLFDPEQAA